MNRHSTGWHPGYRLTLWPHHDSDLRLHCALLEDDTVELTWADLDEYPPVTPPPPALLPLSKLAADSDGDGLTDRVERRLFTDPMAQDTDGDGIVDLADPSPNGGRLPAPESVDAAIDELLRTLFAFWDPACGRRTVLYVLAEPGSERWARGCGPTVNLPASEVETQPRGVDVLVIEPYGDRWGRFGSKSTPPGSVGDLLEAVARPQGRSGCWWSTTTSAPTPRATRCSCAATTPAGS